VHISGFLAWCSWLFIHIFFLIGFRNRAVVIFQWAWSYITFQPAARLITGETATPAIPSLEYVERSAKVTEEQMEAPASGAVDANSASHKPA